MFAIVLKIDSHAIFIGIAGEIRTHGPISELLVFKTSSINRTLTHFHVELEKVLPDV